MKCYQQFSKMFQYVFGKINILLSSSSLGLQQSSPWPTADQRRTGGLVCAGEGGGWPAATMGARGRTDSGVRREKARIRWWTLKFVVSSTNLIH
jgi:hypothetical protein